MTARPPGDNTVDLALTRRMQRLCQGDACWQCEQPTDRLHLVGPIVVTISYPGILETDPDPQIDTQNFCCWECLAQWTAEQAGGEFVVDQG